VCACVLIAPATVSSAMADEKLTLLQLPRLEPCRATVPPRLPEKWRGVFLMSPFTKEQLVLSEIVHDAALPATRVRLFGVKAGAVDLLVAGTKTYALSTAKAGETVCRDLGDSGWRPLPRDLLASEARCAGSAPLGTVSVDWWQMPVTPHPAAAWAWFSASDRSPFRFVFPSVSDRLPPLSRYAMSHQVSFEPLEETDIAGIVASCAATSVREPGEGRRALEDEFAALSRANERADAEISRLMPALDAQCPATSPLRWPATLGMTGMMTPLDSDEAPYPTEILYDWNVRAQRTRIVANPKASFAHQDSLLLGELGYTVTHHEGREPVCRQVLPGAIRPDWPARGPCDCAAVINGTTPLSPHGTTRILACPLASPRVAWAWYAHSGRPTTFMVTSRLGDEATGLFSVLDYLDWLPGYSAPQSVFDKPPQCPSISALRKREPPASRRCFTCHLGSAASD
jgi:hypothetical protein